MRFSIAFLVLSCGFLSSTTALAHKMELVAKFPADRPEVLHVEVGYEGAEPAEGARVRLLYTGGAVVAEGTSNANGVCELPRPAGGSYTLVANDGDGHQAKLALEVPSIPTSETLEMGERATSMDRMLYTVIGIGLIAWLSVAAYIVLRRRSHPRPRAL